MKKIAVITARAGSKGLKDKNILLLNGKPLMAYSIEAAVKSGCFDRIIVSTDSQEYGDIATSYGAEFILRSKENSLDNSTTYDALQELFSKINIKEYNYFILLQPTSPLRNEKHIIEAVKLFEDNYNSYNALSSVAEANKPSVLINTIDENQTMKNFALDNYKNYRRQSYKDYYPNGAIYISKFDHYLNIGHFYGEKSLAYFMNKEDSIDIDNKVDFELASIILNKRTQSNHKDYLKRRIEEKEHNFIKITGKVTLIGHSFFDRWNLKKIKKYKVNNLAITGITSNWYNELIFEKRKFNYLGDYVFVLFGTSDIIYENDINKIVKDINKTIKYIRSNNPKKIIFINISNVNGRIDRDNEYINECKRIFKQEIKSDTIIDLDCLNNKYNKLDEKYTNDGLHLNKLGYEILLKLMEKELE